MGNGTKPKQACADDGSSIVARQGYSKEWPERSLSYFKEAPQWVQSSESNG